MLEKFLDTKKKIEPVAAILVGVGLTLLVNMLTKFFPNETISAGINIYIFWVEWSDGYSRSLTAGENILTFIIGFAIFYFGLVLKRKYRQAK